MSEELLAIFAIVAVVAVACWIFVTIWLLLSRRKHETNQVKILYKKFMQAEDLWNDFIFRKTDPMPIKQMDCSTTVDDLLNKETDFFPVFKVQILILSQFSAQIVTPDISATALKEFEELITKELTPAELHFYKKFSSRILQDYEYNCKLFLSSFLTTCPNLILGSSIAQHLFLNSSEFVENHSNSVVEEDYLKHFLEVINILNEDAPVASKFIRQAQSIFAEPKDTMKVGTNNGNTKQFDGIRQRFENFTPVEKIFRYITIIAEVLLLLALCNRFEYGFYTFLRFVVCAAFVGLVINQRVPPLVKVFTIMGAILYNPIVPVHIGDRDVWCVINVLSIPLFIIGECFVYLNEKKD